MERPEKDYEWLLKSYIGIGDPVRKEKLVQAIKAAISEFELKEMNTNKIHFDNYQYRIG